MRDSKSFFLKLLLAMIFVLSAARLVGFVTRFSRESLQMDFAVYYTAGESLNHGLSPYRNSIDHDPPIWDGVSLYQHSRYLYPPLAANLFRPLALLSYPVAKTLWMILCMACICGAILITHRVFPLRNGVEFLSVGIIAAVFHPLLFNLERGQIDAMTLLLLTWSILALVKGTKGSCILSGLLLSVATLLKLHCVYRCHFFSSGSVGGQYRVSYMEALPSYW
ncbi:MAG: DUF2029 domain-containing protein [Sedimentisphaerales bacterium]|nr:DUF2029 domain-containing protein [Sedimentisphaerales bacterium]